MIQFAKHLFGQGSYGDPLQTVSYQREPMKPGEPGRARENQGGPGRARKSQGEPRRAWASRGAMEAKGALRLTMQIIQQSCYLINSISNQSSKHQIMSAILSNSLGYFVNGSKPSIQLLLFPTYVQIEQKCY